MQTSEALFAKKSVGLKSGSVTYYEGGTGPETLVYVHSGGGLRFGKALGLLTEKLRVLGIIVPGFDATPEHKGIDSTRDVGALVCEFADALGLKTPAILGHSFGGHVAAWSVAHAPAQFASLVLAGTAGFRPPHLGAPTSVGNTPEERAKALSAHPERMVPERRTPEALKRDGEMNRKFPQGKFYDDVLVEKLGSIRCPTLILHGTQERAVPIESSLLLARKIPNALLMYVHDAGHNLDMDQPEQFARVVTQFVSQGAGFATAWPVKMTVAEDL